MMKLNMQINLLCLLVAAGLQPLFGQEERRVVIEPTGIGAIQTAIDADLAATDTATVESTTYVLQRGQRYAYETSYRNAFKLTLVAEEGDGPRPEIIPVPPATGEAPRFIFPQTSDITMIGLNINQKDANGQHTDNAPVRPVGNGVRVYIEDCVFDGQRFEVMRTQGANQRVYLINNIILNNFQQDQWYKGGGLWFQSGNPVDTMVIRDNTYANTPARFTHSINGAVINYLEITNNTVVNVGGMDELGLFGRDLNTPVVDMGIPRNLVVEDNIFYNLGWMGYENDTAYIGKVGVFNLYPDSLETYSFKNNNIYTDSTLLAGTPDAALQIPLLTATLDSFLDAESDMMTGEEFLLSMNISEELEFANAPMNIDSFVKYKGLRWSQPDTADQLYILRLPQPPIAEIDYAYSVSADSYTAGQGGDPLGSSRWFGGITSIPAFQPASGTLGTLRNSPNPVRDFTTISFDLAQDAKVDVYIHDMSGRQLMSRFFGRLSAGNGQRLYLNGLSLPPGIYSYTVVADVGNRRLGATQRMVVQ